MIKIYPKTLKTVLYEGQYETIKQAVECAYLECANLENANLGGANLRDADLENADLRDADLRDIILIVKHIHIKTIKYILTVNNNINDKLKAEMIAQILLGETND